MRLSVYGNTKAPFLCASQGRGIIILAVPPWLYHKISPLSFNAGNTVRHTKISAVRLVARKTAWAECGQRSFSKAPSLTFSLGTQKLLTISFIAFCNINELIILNRYCICQRFLQILLDSRTFVKGVFKKVRFLFGQLRRHDYRGKLSRRRTSATIGAAWVSSILSSPSESARLQTGSTIADFVGGE